VTRYYSAVAVDNTLGSAITSGSTTATLNTSPIGYPSSFPFVLAIDYNAATEELVLVTAVSGTTISITRGFNGSTPQSHAVGAAIRHVITAQDLTDTQTHYNTALTDGAHGVTGSLATFLGAPTSANLAAVVTDETGSGSLVFATGPTINSPVITGTIAASGSTGSSGQYLSSTATGIAWVTPTTTNLVLNPQTGTTYTLVSSDLNKLVTLSNSSAITLTIPSATFTTGQQINIQQIGAGQVTVQGDGTSTFTGTGTKLRTQYSAATIVCTGTNTFTLIGDLA